MTNVGPPSRVVDQGAELEHAVVIEGLAKTYGQNVAVRALSMHVPTGSVYGFLGPNGAGKTSTLRILATLDRPDVGVVKVEGIDVARKPRLVRWRIGYMPDAFGMHERLTVAEYLNFYAACYGIDGSKRRQLAAELLELVDLTDRRADQVSDLSRGMQQQLQLARCLIHDPSLLLLDEPASGMDPTGRTELFQVLTELAGLGKSVVISSHILPEIAGMCSHLGIIQSGALIAEGPVHAIAASFAPLHKLRLTLLDPLQAEAASAVLEDDAHCRNVERHDESAAMIAGFEGGEAEAAALMRRLLGAEVLLSSFTLEPATLEEVFVTATDVAEPVE